ncbi:MAG: hypothetical protein A2Z87_06175 [Gallionellales bacterium GWA2_54_124]|nr:MAG: hypothetical protein A2Z87_06175 [Gallionellales bacterium GWA2_54_124]
MASTRIQFSAMALAAADLILSNLWVSVMLLPLFALYHLRLILFLVSAKSQIHVRLARLFLLVVGRLCPQTAVIQGVMQFGQAQTLREVPLIFPVLLSSMGRHVLVDRLCLLLICRI